MSILTETLPDHLVVSGKKCKIKTDFKTWLKFSEIISGNEAETEKTLEILTLIFVELPPNLHDAFVAMGEFYVGEQRKGKGGEGKSKAVYDFEFDAGLIYAAFLQQYGIDLCETDMHWWKFRALFNGLSEDTRMAQVMQYRSVDLSKIKDNEMRMQYMKLKSAYRLPEKRSEAQKEADMVSSFEKMF